MANHTVRTMKSTHIDIDEDDPMKTIRDLGIECTESFIAKLTQMLRYENLLGHESSKFSEFSEFPSIHVFVEAGNGDSLLVVFSATILPRNHADTYGAEFADCILRALNIIPDPEGERPAS